MQAAGGTEWLAHYLMTWSRLDAPLAGAIVAIAFVGGRLQPAPRWLGPAGVVGRAYSFDGDRQAVRRQTCQAALDLLAAVLADTA